MLCLGVSDIFFKNIYILHKKGQKGPKMTAKGGGGGGVVREYDSIGLIDVCKGAPAR